MSYSVEYESEALADLEKLDPDPPQTSCLTSQTRS